MTKQLMTIFGYAEGCPACDNLKSYLTQKNIPFQSINIERDSQLRDEFRKLGYSTVPICYVDGWYVGGKDEVINSLKVIHGEYTEYQISPEIEEVVQNVSLSGP